MTFSRSIVRDNASGNSRTKGSLPPGLTMIRERVNAGLARAKAQGKRLGRPPISAETEAAIRKAKAGIRASAPLLAASASTSPPFIGSCPARLDRSLVSRNPSTVIAGLDPIGVRIGRPEQRPRSIRTPLVMPGLGPGIHELITRRRGDRGGERHSAYSAAPRDHIPPELVDARAKPWHDDEARPNP